MADEKTNSDLQWEKFSDIIPERDDVKLPEDDLESLEGLEHGGLNANMRKSPKLSDAQTFDKRLFPTTGYEWLDRIQVSEVFPDTYNYLFRIFIRSLMRQSKGKMTLAEAIATAHTACSIGLTREGRIDVLALSGSITAANEESKKNNPII